MSKSDYIEAKSIIVEGRRKKKMAFLPKVGPESIPPPPPPTNPFVLRTTKLPFLTSTPRWSYMQYDINFALIT